MNAQRDLNELEKANGIKSVRFDGWITTDKDGTVYMVKAFQEREQLSRNLARMNKDATG